MHAATARTARGRHSLLPQRRGPTCGRALPPTLQPWGNLMHASALNHPTAACTTHPGACARGHKRCPSRPPTQVRLPHLQCACRPHATPLAHACICAWPHQIRPHGRMHCMMQPPFPAPHCHVRAMYEPHLYEAHQLQQAEVYDAQRALDVVQPHVAWVGQVLGQHHVLHQLARGLVVACGGAVNTVQQGEGRCQQIAS